ncbi:hypothetical protein QLQ15_12200 [Lysobacter sp. LF1]|uniref:Histidine kinase n=1 Tax=Lysobacter stagni TaxID=3045172 RepID=A0ABT6XHN9_9GAMM|nr:hypothetical protein [Lysobacter sp. LF1]MDI9239666.1 hypothetical protein [Lysobacter sp. LF1]
MTVPSTHAHDTGQGRQWMHRLRNELNTITMANAAAMSLIDHGEPIERVREHLSRAEAACRRCQDLLRDDAEEV